MIASDGDRRFQVAAFHEFINRFTHLGALAVTKPTDARRKTLELNAVAGQTQPTIQSRIVWEKLQREVVGLLNITRITGQRDPAKWTFAFTEERANVLRDETGNLKRILHACIKRHLPDVVAVIKRHGA